ncbi:undecaprenyldiphospho-muramoylpentapeptide beta-N-acetylglucosaminyltransferase [Pseudoxanthobacter sp.]|uniref:undecaprenyldiphospho-muramoylpentapeptide beta-N-acetylglucosaminyltransferase n=1 Tax=Pseudoxanthobacter sp. TaxID=1925742 RepID=UPI002FE2C03C
MTRPGGKTVLLAAGGTGGHLFPAQALAHALGERGWTVDLITDERADKYGSAFPARTVHIVASATVTGRSPVALARTGFALARGLVQSLGIVGRVRPAVVVGFGGYPTVPPLTAARLRGVPTILHEQNAVVGWANRLLAKHATRIATGFERPKGTQEWTAKLALTGNPVRPAVLEAARTPYEAPVAGGAFRLLVFGGSQGARAFADLVPPAIARLDPALRARLKLTQQARPEDMERVRRAYADLGVAAELAPFFTDMPARMAASHLIVCRSGASSVAELSVIGRPAVLVPLPHARDQDQATNAAVLAGVGAAWPIAQTDLTADPDRLAKEITQLAGAPERLAAAAAAARAIAMPDAVERLADLVEATARKDGDLTP